MRKYIFLISLCISASVFFGCTDISNLTIPKKVTVKVNPTYDLSLGNFEKDLSEEFDLVNSIKEKAAKAGIEAYDYNPGGLSSDLQQIIFKKTIQEIPVDMDQYFRNSELSGMLNDFSFSQEIEIPSIDYESEEVMDLSDLNDQLLQMVIIGGLTTGGDLSIDFDDNGSRDSFESMTFDEGYLVIETLNDYSGNSVALSYGGYEIVRGNFSGNTARLDLSGKTLYSNGMSVDFYSKRDGSAFLGHIESGKLSKVTGLTISSIRTPMESTVDTASAFDGFESCIIKEGEVRFSMTSWKDISIEYPVTLTGGIEGNSTAFGVNGQKIDLANKSVKPQDTMFNSNVKISCKKGTIDFQNPPVIKTEIDIREIESIVVSMDEIEPIEDSVELPQEFMTTVKQIDMGRSVISMTYVNTMPEGNGAIEINFVSKFLGIDTKEDMVRRENDGLIEFKAKSTSKLCYISSAPEEDDEFNTLDYKIDVKMPGVDPSNPNMITLKNVKPGDKYKIECKIDSAKTNFVWNKIVLDTSDYTQTDTVDSGLDLSSITEELSDYLEGSENAQLNLQNFDFYLFASKPQIDAFKNVKFTGRTSIYTDKDDSAKCVYLLGSQESSGEMRFSDLPIFDIEDGVITTDIKSFENSCYENLAKVMNNSSVGESLCIDYDLSFTTGSDTKELEITPDMLGNNKSNIAIVVYMVLPFKFHFDGDVNLNISKILGMNEDDLLGRDGASDENDILDIIKSLELKYDFTKLPFNGDDFSFEINLYGENDENHKVENPGTKGNVVLDSMTDLMNVYPLCPSFKIVFPENAGEELNWISIPRELLARAKLDLKIEAYKEIEF